MDLWSGWWACSIWRSLYFHWNLRGSAFTSIKWYHVWPVSGGDRISHTPPCPYKLIRSVSSSFGSFGYSTHWDFTIEGQIISNLNQNPSYLMKITPVFSDEWFGSVDEFNHIADSRWRTLWCRNSLMWSPACAIPTATSDPTGTTTLILMSE